MTDSPQRFARSADELPTPAEVAALTGTEFMRGIASGRLTAAPIAEHADTRLADVGDGQLVFEAEPRFAHYNPNGNILRPAFESTGPLRATGRSVHAGRRTATGDARLEDADGRLYATGTTTCLVIELPQ